MTIEDIYKPYDYLIILTARASKNQICHICGKTIPSSRNILSVFGGKKKKGSQGKCLHYLCTYGNCKKTFESNTDFPIRGVKKQP